MGLLIALLLVGSAVGEPQAVEKYDAWLAASNEGSLLATAQVCEFDDAEVQQMVGQLEYEAIQKATSNGVDLDSATYREAFLIGNAKMHSLLGYVLPQQTEARKQQACAEVRTQWELLRQTLSPADTTSSEP